MTASAIYPRATLSTIDLETVTRNDDRPSFSPEPDKKLWDQTPSEDLSTVSMSTSLLALGGALAAEQLHVGSHHFSKPAADFETFQHASLGWGKRTFDILFSACALLAFLPVLIACAVAVKLESGGAVFFRQRRIGKNGELFEIVKFRTMVEDAEKVLNAYLAIDAQARAEWNADRKLKKDPRITRAGAIMRKFSLDELPQFWNVFKGDMSIVGPRPIVKAEVQFYADDFRQYTEVRPGITGLWQVSGRNDVSYASRVALDCRYVQSWSLVMDFGILLKTVSTVIRASGAY